MKLPAATGIYPNLSREVYDEIDRMNWSTSKHFARSARHVLQAIIAKARDRDALKFGRVDHLAVLEPGKLDSEVSVWRGGDKRTNAKEWKAFKEANASREILTEEEYASCLALAKSVRADPIAARLLSGGEAEVTVLWDHVAFDGSIIQCKARLDYLSASMVDLKSTQNASPEAFGRACWNYGYHAQTAMYLDGLIAAGGDPRPAFLLAVEKEEPFTVQAYRVAGEVLERGRIAYRSYLDQLAACRSTGNWPGYGTSEMDLTLPHWTHNLVDGAPL